MSNFFRKVSSSVRSSHFLFLFILMTIMGVGLILFHHFHLKIPGIPVSFCEGSEERGGAEASSSAPLQQEGASSPAGSPSSSDLFPFLRLSSPELRDLIANYEKTTAEIARDTAQSSISSPIAIPTLPQDIIWDSLSQKNISLEMSLKNRIMKLKESPFLLGKTADQYWSDLKLELAKAPSQKEYNRLIDFENKDLLIRELKQESFTLWNHILTKYPTLREKAPYNPGECFIDYLTEKEEQLSEQDTEEGDKKTVAFLNEIIKNSRKLGPEAPHIKQIVDPRLPWER